jgi:signal transduction histidine kinase
MTELILKDSASTRKRTIGYILVAVWLIFTLSLSAWWLFFSLNQLDLVRSLESSRGQEVLRHQKMLLYEGLTLLASLLVGAVALIYYILKVVKQNQEISRFFATFSHELRTPLASLKLQAESLKEDLAHQPQYERLLNRLVSDAERLSLQLENSLFLAQSSWQSDQNSTFWLEEIQLSEFLRKVAEQWPALKIELINDCYLQIDRRVAESIFRNIFHNALVHGEAKRVVIESSLETRNDSSTTGTGDQFVCLQISDDGVGFKGERSKLGKAFARPAKSSGNGLGLAIVADLLKGMGGALFLLDNLKELETKQALAGFSLQIKLKGRVLT